MGAPIKNMNPADEASADALLTSLRTIAPAERRKHASVFNYWLSIRGKRQFPAIRDLDPLEISDAGPFSLLMEMIGGGDDAEIRHFGHAIKGGVDAHRISDAQAPSLLSCIHAKLPVVASSRQAFAFEDRFDTPEGPPRCWVTLLPLSASGTWIDFVYGFVSLDGTDAAKDAEPEAVEVAQPVSSADEAAEDLKVELRPYDDAEAAAADATDAVFESDEYAAPEADPVAELEPELEPEPELEHVPELEPEPVDEPVAELEPEPVFEPEPQPEPTAEAGFSSKLLAGLASVGGFYGKVIQSQPIEPKIVEPDVPTAEEFEPDAEPELVAEVEVKADPDFVAESDEEFKAELQSEPEPEPEPELEPHPQPEPEQATAQPVAMEASLQDKLSGVRAMAEEARKAQERSNMALYEGLGAAYDFALDAEDQPEDYLRLVESQGLKIQLRSPMKPVVKLAFAGLTDDQTIGQLEAVLAWALKADLPRGSLAERIVAEGGIGQILGSKPN